VVGLRGEKEKILKTRSKVGRQSMFGKGCQQRHGGVKVGLVVSGKEGKNEGVGDFLRKGLSPENSKKERGAGTLGW